MVAAVLLAVFLASMTVAPIPSASIFTLAPALAAAGVPTAGLGLLLGIDRIPDMFPAGVNQAGHMSAVVVAVHRGDGRTWGGPFDPRQLLQYILKQVADAGPETRTRGCDDG